MTKSTGCSECGLKLGQIEQIYERRLNSLADTFLSLVNNIENDSLFRGLQMVQIIQNRKDFELKQLKQKVYSIRMEFLQSLIEGMISQEQQNTIKKLETQNAQLRNENSYFHKIIEYNQLSYRNFQSETFDEHQNFNPEPFCQSQYEEQEHYRNYRNEQINQVKQKFNKPKQNGLMKVINRSKLNFKFSTQEIDSSESQKTYETPDSTSFVVNLKQNGSQDLSNNCISSIDPVSQTSSFPISQKSFVKLKPKPRLNPNHQIFTVSLREQLSTLNSNSKRIQNLPFSESRRKRPIKKIIQDEQNEENIEPKQYQFKYLKF